MSEYIDFITYQDDAITQRPLRYYRRNRRRGQPHPQPKSKVRTHYLVTNIIESIVGTCHYIAIIDSETLGKIGIHDLFVEFTTSTTYKQIIQDAASVFTKDLFEY